MTVKKCAGTVVTLGQYEYDMQGTRYAYIEIERDDGRVLRANNVLVLNNVGGLLSLGVEGEFYFDSAFLKAGIIRQLFGIRRNDGRWAYDAMQARVLAAVINIVWGFLHSFVLVGIPVLAGGLFQLVYSVGTAQLRRSAFFGPDGPSGASARRAAAIRI